MHGPTVFIWKCKWIDTKCTMHLLMTLYWIGPTLLFPSAGPSFMKILLPANIRSYLNEYLLHPVRLFKVYLKFSNKKDIWSIIENFLSCSLIMSFAFSSTTSWMLSLTCLRTTFFPSQLNGPRPLSPMWIAPGLPTVMSAIVEMDETLDLWETATLSTCQLWLRINLLLQLHLQNCFGQTCCHFTARI